ncbi:28S ribosomal protein S28, mitochondrial [Leptopilina heterotoma]|uniref:28S ribosomal protein S28, mitochondrial n=1 Tax=Leptopilina heterotoma TaxID=63436 RepID=UPI001CA8FBF9|nr:28S ribosomal protein S28, mitochondrial [Leptopilina heterotoma]
MQRLEKLCNQIRKTNSVASCPTFARYLCTEKSNDQEVRESLEKSSLLADSIENQLRGFAKSVEKYKTITEKKVVKGKSFVTLLRNSKLMDLGDPNGRVVKGKVIHVVENDLHIDFGWKFNCVCKRPALHASDYVRGSIVRLKIKELELSTRFLGSTKDLTILEADCILLGLLWSPLRTKTYRV